MALTPRRMIEVSLQRMLAGAVHRLGGSERVGIMLGEIIEDPETDRKDRLAGLTTIVKLTGQFVPAENEDSEDEPEKIVAMMKKLDAEYAAGGGSDGEGGDDA